MDRTTSSYTLSGLVMNSSWNEFWSSAESYTNSTFIPSNDDYNCDVWSMPSRVVLQIFCLATLLLNIAAAVVVFGVPTHVRGKHVSFLFACVRLLNLLDIWQCLLLFFVPIFIPKNCDPATAFCDVTGYLFTSATLFSPLVAIVMAVDRAAAVYFHVQYKANPRTKIKYASLISILGFYGVYLVLPCFTHFGAYVAVPWLSLCSFEWGVTSRSFDLILTSITIILIVVLIVANIAILIKMRMRKKQIERMKRLNTKEQKRKPKEENKYATAETFQLKKLHRSADDLMDISSNECSTFAQTSIRLSKRIGKFISPGLRLSDAENNEEQNGHKVDIAMSTFCPNHSLSPLVTPPPNTSRKWKYTWSNGRRPQSVISPCTTTSMLSPHMPCLSTSSRQRSPLPQISSSDKEVWNIPELKSRSLKRSSSADDINKSSGSPSKFTFCKQNTPPLLRRVLENPTGKFPDLDNQSSNNTGTSDENNTPRRTTASSSTSFFSAAFFATKGTTKRMKRQRKSRRMRKNVSKITQMTTTICLVFVIFYFPFMIRKLIQLVPNDYTTVRVPASVEIATLFGPLLSPLCNPIIYVFLNPHYKRHCLKLLRKIFQTCSTCSKGQCCFSANISNRLQLFKKQKIRRRQWTIRAERTAESHSSLDDVFLPENSEKNQKCYEPKRNLDKIRNKHLLAIKPLKDRSISAV